MARATSPSYSPAAPCSATRRSEPARPGRWYTRPGGGAAPNSGGAGASSHWAVLRKPEATPRSAASMASARQASRPSLP